MLGVLSSTLLLAVLVWLGWEMIREFCRPTARDRRAARLVELDRRLEGIEEFFERKDN